MAQEQTSNCGGNHLHEEYIEVCHRFRAYFLISTKYQQCRRSRSSARRFLCYLWIAINFRPQHISPHPCFSIQVRVATLKRSPLFLLHPLTNTLFEEKTEICHRIMVCYPQRIKKLLRNWGSVTYKSISTQFNCLIILIPSRYIFHPWFLCFQRIFLQFDGK